MSPPSATYRIQFREGMTFERATALIPYLKRLGISHLYASPIFTATKGSTHGYDIVDCNEIDPAIGGRAGFERMADALQAAGLGLILDIVPNHMAASLENPWWRSVVEWGEQSPYANHFDIDWSRPLTLPMLGQPIDRALDTGELKFAVDAKQGALTLAYFDNHIPLRPDSYARVLAGLDTPLAHSLPALAEKARPGNTASFHDQVRALLHDEKAAADLNRSLARLSEDHEALRKTLSQQAWRLLYWRDAASQLTYRRFFEVTGLAGLRVEDAVVFEEAHRLILDLVKAGRVDGLRIDHVDGLADPKAYLDRLRQEVGKDTYIIVEKILAAGEDLPGDWPISGTTGYEFISALSSVFADDRMTESLDRHYHEISGMSVDFPAEVGRVKMQLLEHNLAVEASNLLRLLAEIGALTEDQPTAGNEPLKTALHDILAAFPTYRTYGTQSGLGQTDLDLWKDVIDRVCSLPQPPATEAIAFIDRVFRGDIASQAGAKASEFRRRFQQLTGPLAAKSIEDTMFYRFNRLIALNEVGGEAESPEQGLEYFHAAMQERVKRQPYGLSATSTHDTKRGEDARARLYAISEAPDLWSDGVRRWRSINASHVQHLKSGPAPDAETEWMLYQALMGVWPSTLSDAEPLPADLEDRFLAYIEKSLREAKQRTNWNAVDEEYETAVKTYGAWLLSPTNTDFLRDFRRTIRPFIRAGLFNGLSQTLIKLAGPGVPDIYQGAEALDLSLVDPDNRRMPSFSALDSQLSAALPLSREASLNSGALKQRLIATCLDCRRENATLFSEGDYMPLRTTGRRSQQVISFLRRQGDRLAIAIATRFLFSLEDSQWPCADFWADTAVTLPDEYQGRRMRNILDGTPFEVGQSLPLATIMTRLPVALLVNAA